MITYKNILWLLLFTATSFTAMADQVINDDLIVSAVSDGTAPAYDCSAGAKLPLSTTPSPPYSNNIFDSSSVTATIPVGDPIVFPVLKTPAVVTNIGGVDYFEYTCSTPEGSTCIGFDCSSNEAFNGDTLKLKENNIRIRFLDTSIADGFGQSWNIEANSSRNEGASYLDFQIKSIDADTIRLVTALDGAVPSYDCSVAVDLTVNNPLPLPPVTGTIPVGSPLITPTFPLDIASACNPYPTSCLLDCNPAQDFQVQSVLTFGTANPVNALGNSVAIGNSSEFEANAVSVGKASLLRRIASVAKGINATDLLTLDRIDDYSVVEDQIAQAAVLRQKIVNMNRQLDVVSLQVAALEAIKNPDDDDDGFSDIDEGICGTNSLDDTSVPVDSDGDKLCDAGVDSDDDNDGVPDTNDAFPLDPSESVDSDGDGTGDNADTDDDNDGVSDSNDAYPKDPTESVDTDGDGTGDNADTDDDNDGVSDSNDAFPKDPTESVDTDGDGTGNTADTDDDNDGVLDSEDEFPLDATKSTTTTTKKSGSFSILGLCLLSVIGLIRRRYTVSK